MEQKTQCRNFSPLAGLDEYRRLDFVKLIPQRKNPDMDFFLPKINLTKRLFLGWIPREQFLGKESRVDSVDEKFVVQRNEIANPPTLLLTLHSMV